MKKIKLFGIGLSTLVAFVTVRQRLNPLWSLELFLHRWRFRNLVKPVRAINKAFIPKKAELREKEQLRAWEAVRKEFVEILQLELYLLDEKEMLEAEQDVASSLTSDQEATMEMIQGELGWIRPRLWLNGQRFSDLHLQWVEGCWTLEKKEVPSQQKFHKGSLSCLLSLGCCARDCGCCLQPRRTLNGKQNTISPNMQAHCTIQCGCCIRWRGHHHFTGSKKAEIGTP